MSDVLTYAWRAPVTEAELLELAQASGGRGQAGWWDTVRSHSLGWVTARTAERLLVGFVNVAWDGGHHAFLLDTRTRGDRQRRGVGTALVVMAVGRAREAGCEWLHVDFVPDLAPFYFEACGFRPTAAGLVQLTPRTG